MRGCLSGQKRRIVNPLVYTYVGSNPTSLNFRVWCNGNIPVLGTGAVGSIPTTLICAHSLMVKFLFCNQVFPVRLRMGTKQG